MTTREVLLAAAAEIERSGHHKHWFWRDSFEVGPCCAIGAIRRVVGDDYATGVTHRTLDPAEAVGRWLRKNGHPGMNGALSVFNDDPDRTADEVIDALQSCAADLRLRGEP